MRDRSHLAAIELRLSHERERLRRAKTDKERELREVWVAQIEKERVAELRFLGIDDSFPELSDDELLKALME